MTYHLTEGEQRALLRVLHPQVQVPRPDPLAPFLGRDAAPSPERTAGSCATCADCRFITGDATGEAWVRYLQRNPYRDRSRRIGWRGCPDCNPTGRLPYRDPGSGELDRQARYPKQQNRRLRQRGR